MATEDIELIIEGEPGEEVQVWYRGDRDRDPGEGDPAPLVYTGNIGSDGSLTISVPRAYLVLGRPVRRSALVMELHLEEKSTKTKTVQLPKEKT